MTKILFVCKYNRFRSRVAEQFFKKYNSNKKNVAKSAGVIRGSYPLDKSEAKIAEEFGIKLHGYPQGLTTEIMKWQEILIIVADDVPPIMFENKKYGKKLIVWKIPDAKSNEKQKIRNTIKKIEENVIKLIGELK